MGKNRRVDNLLALILQLGWATKTPQGTYQWALGHVRGIRNDLPVISGQKPVVDELFDGGATFEAKMPKKDSFLGQNVSF